MDKCSEKLRRFRHELSRLEGSETIVALNLSDKRTVEVMMEQILERMNHVNSTKESQAMKRSETAISHFSERLDQILNVSQINLTRHTSS